MLVRISSLLQTLVRNPSHASARVKEPYSVGRQANRVKLRRSSLVEILQTDVISTHTSPLGPLPGRHPSVRSSYVFSAPLQCWRPTFGNFLGVGSGT